MKYQHAIEMVGNTPSILIGNCGNNCKIFLKLEGMNPSGSIKDRACVFMLRDAISTGGLKRDKVILDASSGNFACAIAYFGATLGYRCAVAVSSKLTLEKRRFLKYFGATVHNVGNFTIEGNRFCKTLADRDPEKYCFLDQLHNWNNPRAHYESTGPEILAEFPDVSMIVGSLGSGGSMAGIARYFKAVAPHVTIVVVKCASGSRIPGIGSFCDGDYLTPFIKDAYASAHFDESVLIDQDGAQAAARSACRHGVFAGLQTGGVLRAAEICAEASEVKGSIVVLSGDTGWKNLNKLTLKANI